MSEEDDSSKTEEPSGKKLEDARKKGQIVQSRDVSTLLMLTAGAVVVLLLGPMLMQKVLTISKAFLEKPHLMHIDPNDIYNMFAEVTLATSFSLLVSLGLLVVAAFLSGYLQFGLLIKEDFFEFDLSKISPMKGLSRMFSLQSVMELVKGVAKMMVVGGLCYMVLAPAFNQVDSVIQMEIGGFLDVLFSLTAKIIFAVLGAMVVLAGGDYLFQRFQFMKQMRMTKQELKDEYKQSEGDPHIKGRIKQLRAERARRRMMAAVPTATVVVTNPTHFAVALKYETNMPAPKLVAKGADIVALRIRELAQKNFVPIVENPPLARALYASVELDEEIPPDQYKAVAEVISYVFKITRRTVH